MSELRQEDQPPDLGLALLVVVLLLDDLRAHLMDEHDDNVGDLVIRLVTVKAVIERIRARVQEDQP